MSSLELIFLGTGTSQGVPIIGCDCSVCLSEDPRDKRTRTSALVRTPDIHFVIDTAPEFRLQCLREGVGRLDAALFTHAHTDHIMGFDDMRRFSEMQNGCIPVYATTSTMDCLRSVYHYAFDDPKPWSNYLRIDPRPIMPNQSFPLGESEILPVELPHGQVTTTGYILYRGGRKVLAYFTDCSEIPEDVAETARGVGVLVIDALRDAFHPTHLSFEGAIDAVKMIEPRNTYFIHMSHDVSHARRSSELPEGCRLAYDGLRIPLDQ